MSEQETVFADGFIIKHPHENAPDFVKASVSIKADEAIEFIKKHAKEDGWLNLDLLESKDKSKMYMKKNTWEKPEGSTNPVEKKEDESIPF